ncbi:MAG: HAD family hydrolase [Firmicutes bacterium]|nr:HAD family hydrolase [Bacillota bacterium]
MNEPQTLKGIDAVLFDLDGTLWDSSAGVAAAWSRALAENAPGLRPPITDAEFRSCMGLQIPDIGARVFPMLQGGERDRLVQFCLDEEEDWLRENGGTVYPKVEETLAELSRHYALGLVSNCQCGYIENFFRLTGLGRYFRDFESFGGTGLHKSENIRLVMSRNGYASACYVGDMILDQKAARGAKVPFVYCSYGFGELDDWDFRIDSFAQLLPLLV